MGALTFVGLVIEVAVTGLTICTISFLQYLYKVVPMKLVVPLLVQPSITTMSLKHKVKRKNYQQNFSQYMYIQLSP